MPQRSAIAVSLSGWELLHGQAEGSGQRGARPRLHPGFVVGVARGLRTAVWESRHSAGWPRRESPWRIFAAGSVERPVEG